MVSGNCPTEPPILAVQPQGSYLSETRKSDPFLSKIRPKPDPEPDGGTSPEASTENPEASVQRLGGGGPIQRHQKI